MRNLFDGLCVCLLSIDFALLLISMNCAPCNKVCALDTWKPVSYKQLQLVIINRLNTRT